MCRDQFEPPSGAKLTVMVGRTSVTSAISIRPLSKGKNRRRNLTRALRVTFAAGRCAWAMCRRGYMPSSSSSRELARFYREARFSLGMNFVKVYVGCKLDQGHAALAFLVDQKYRPIGDHHV